MALYGLTIEENTPYHSSKLAVNDDQQAIIMKPFKII